MSKYSSRSDQDLLTTIAEIGEVAQIILQMKEQGEVLTGSEQHEALSFMSELPPIIAELQHRGYATDLNVVVKP